MCLYDNIRYICSDEEHTLAELCDAATRQCAQLQCAPYVRHVLFSTSVCDLCGIAWEQSALTGDAYDRIITPLLGSDRKRSHDTGSYFPTDALFVASPPSTLMRRLSPEPLLTPSEVATAFEEVSEGMFNANIALPILPDTILTGDPFERSPKIVLSDEALSELKSSHNRKEDLQNDLPSASPIAAFGTTAHRRRES
ncbi:hypothetical protein CKM354_000360600 [Cercospora kikuchii]|uniref:Uncharacterized protein n=1 Tax=Cercospora kikuchii TaxID=84275 RepID=A0A9P3CKP4_9PEZI|nr:uncharacterized protein CKM354_000360600 [Cercospora kikuchii]GIZ40258.1 hypothetical protein CKM354_000360600 [Cercospora kikuchii]